MNDGARLVGRLGRLHVVVGDAVRRRHLKVLQIPPPVGDQVCAVGDDGQREHAAEGIEADDPVAQPVRRRPRHDLLQQASASGVEEVGEPVSRVRQHLSGLDGQVVELIQLAFSSSCQELVSGSRDVDADDLGDAETIFPGEDKIFVVAHSGKVLFEVVPCFEDDFLLPGRDGDAHDRDVLAVGVADDLKDCARGVERSIAGRRADFQLPQVVKL